ncbi:Uncharacterized protein TCM_010646 [Theobroma cacao]|uniref:RNase H type-1 domain-containing protein n=1 Tax=Theobroma cacao TaxID=3641 RepID=A0A061E6V3_THECC|nr:Uncharacterized protein TCM_010646 [Theobroma cacao]
MKFNVDGAARGCSGPTRIRGILRDHRGEVKIIFSNAIGEIDSNFAEMMAVKAVKWTKHPDVALWRMRKLILQTEILKREVEGWEIQHVKREVN